MARLFKTLLIVVALLAALDRLVAAVTPNAEIATVDAERHDQFRHAIGRQFNDLRSGISRVTHAALARWNALPNEKRPRELRVVLIGNSSPMFALAPSVLTDRLSAAFPERLVTVTALYLPGIHVLDEEPLVRAALRKHADVVILTPNLKSLVAEPSDLSGTTRKLFAERLEGTTSFDPSDDVDDFLERHWRLYRDRELIRTRVLDAIRRRFPWRGQEAQSYEDADAAFGSISEAAARGDMHELVATYRSHGLGAFVAGPMFRTRLHPRSPVFGIVSRLATAVQDGGAMGIAIFMPVHPLFRNAHATADFPELQLDDLYVKGLAARVLDTYRTAGFTTFDRVDALPASAFIDLIHVNADGMQAFSREMADTLTEAIRKAERAG